MAVCPDCGTSYPRHIQICPRDGTVLQDERADDPVIGQTLDGKYRVESLIGQGGMGTVYRATHLMLGKPVALKLIKPELVTSKDIARRFQREARAASNLNHPGIATVYDLGQTGDGTLYIAMEFVNGPSLKDALADGPLPADRVVRIVRQIATALAAAHEMQIVHRDLKPQNVILAKDAAGREVAKLLDFGIAKTFDDGATKLTSTGIVIGTPQYMSPEQASGSDVDGRSDLYALGVIAYEMLTGVVPFTAPNTLALLVKQMHEAPVPPSVRRPEAGIPPALEALALRCLEKDPEKRYQTAGEVAAALEAFAPGTKSGTTGATEAAGAATVVLSGRPQPRDPREGTTVLLPDRAPALPPASVPHVADRPRGRLIAAIAAAAGVTVIAGLGYWNGWFRSAPPPTVPSEPPSAPIGDTARVDDDAQRAELALWDAIKGSTDPAMFDTFVSRYPSSQFRASAEARAAELRRTPSPARGRGETPVTSPPPAPVVPNPGPPAAEPPPDPSAGLGARWARISAGTFQMGCVPGDADCTDEEKPRHAVTLTRPFDLMTTEVTLGMFRAYATGTGKSLPAQPEWSTNARQPVVNVTWDEAVAMCGWLGGRLPTEAEWERAARGGIDGARFPWGDEPPTASPGARSGARFDSSGATPVGTFAANGYGLFDMAGNVWEWVADRFAPYSGASMNDPRGPASGERRVVRGGSWNFNPRLLRVSLRINGPPVNRDVSLGFRCGRDVQ
jgi:serine/threonine-protein kinase